MAGGQKKLEAEIRIKGKADGSLNQLASTLQTISTIAQGISKPIQEVLKDSLEYYKGYEKNMLDAKGALSAQYDSYAELERVMSNLDTQAQNWAASTIFHTSDVSKAISEAAHAGWSYEEMTSGIPAAMQLAQAGGYELSSALDQVIKVTNASGTAFEDVGGMIDMWTMAANLGATSVEEMGGALTRMGSTIQFAGGMDQAFTMLTLLANMGTVGEEAGTLLRNSMLRLVAPTKKAGEAMAALEITDDEADELAADADALAAANKQLEKYGFSVYNEKGELKDMTTIFSDLAGAVDGMTDQDRNTLLSAIFPTRTITGAMNLLKSIENGSWTEVLSQMAEAKGYAAEVAGIQNESYANQIELFTSKIEKLKTKIGSIVAPNLEKVMTTVGGVLDKINGLDDTSAAGFTGFLEGIAAAGPISTGVAAIGGFFTMLNANQRIIFLSALGVSALAGAIGALIEVSNQDFKSNFGDMSLDITTLNNFVSNIGTEFVDGTGQITTAYTELTSAITAYEDSVGSFMSGIDTATITGKALTPQEISALKEYGSSIGTAVLDGITSAEQLAKAELNSVYANADGEVAPEHSVMYNALWNNLESLYGGLSEQAASVGSRLGKAMSDALSDNVISVDEQSIIDSLVQEYNAIEQQVAAILAQKNLYEQINAASSVSWDTFETFAANTEASYKDTVAKENAIIDGLEATERMAIEKRLGPLTDEQWLNRLEYKALEKRRSERLADAAAQYQRPMDIAVDTLMGSSEAADAWKILRDMQAAGVDASAFADPGMWSQFSDKSIPELFNQFDVIGDVFARLGKIAPELINSEDMLGYRETAGLMRQRAQVSKEQYTASGLSPEAFASQYNPTGKKITVDIAANTNPAEQQIDSALNGKTYTVNVNASVRQSGLPSMLRFAEGGRSTEAAIFGEAGAEWAIPEQHSERTADLLDSARKASGFTWGELISRTGGLNSKSMTSGSTFVYSPTINASDSSGVADALARDKETMKRWWKRMQQQDSMEVYA